MRGAGAFAGRGAGIDTDRAMAPCQFDAGLSYSQLSNSWLSNMTSDPASDPRPHLLRELSLVSRKLSTLFDARVRSRGLTFARARMLLQLAGADGLTQGELAEVLAIEQPTVVRQIDAMQAAGLVERLADENDRRVKRVMLTASGRSEANGVLALTDELRAELCDGIPAAELATATAVLRRIGERIGAAS